jgi:hypothetical protein
MPAKALQWTQQRQVQRPLARMRLILQFPHLHPFNLLPLWEPGWRESVKEVVVVTSCPQGRRMGEVGRSV